MSNRSNQPFIKKIYLILFLTTALIISCNLIEKPRTELIEVAQTDTGTKAITYTEDKEIKFKKVLNNEYHRHELGHIIGYPHEHEKWNRNDYLDRRIDGDYIYPIQSIINEYREWQETYTCWLFFKCTRTVSNGEKNGVNLINGFDYESIMNYGPNYTLQPFFIKNTDTVFESPGYISTKDKQGVNILYPKK